MAARITKEQLHILLKNGVVKSQDGNKYTILTNHRACNSAGLEPEYGRQENHKNDIACFKIKTPLFVARQFMRHRSFSYLEMSRRYTKDSKVPFEFWFPQDFNIDAKQSFTESWHRDYYWMVTQNSAHTQVASRFLPQTTYTEFYIMGEVYGLQNFFTLRCAKEAQEEIREVAMAMLKLIAKHQPELYKKVLP